MKFAHIADCHLGCWGAHPQLAEMPLRAFEAAVDTCIEEHVEFVLICGDLFHTSLPSIDVISVAARQLRRLKEKEISVFTVAGSHDFSPSGKTMLTVFENAGLISRVSKGKEIDGKLQLEFTRHSGIRFSGMVGRKGGLEEEWYKNLSVPDEHGFKIFCFHSAISDFNPDHLKDMGGIPLSLMPKGFNYYAGGHVHHRSVHNEKDIGTIVYPGSLFPDNFDELERYGYGGFAMVNIINAEDIKVSFRDIKLFDTFPIKIDADGKTAKDVEREILGAVEGQDLTGKLVLIKVKGVLSQGKPSDIDFKLISDACRAAFAVKRNFNQLTTKEFEEIKIESGGSVENLEERLIKESLGQIKLPGIEEKALVEGLMHALEDEKNEGETNETFLERIVESALKIIKQGSDQGDENAA